MTSSLVPLTVSLPPGPFTCLLDATGAVHAAGFGDLDGVVGRLPAGTPVDRDAQPGKESEPIRAALQAYAEGDLSALDGVVVEQPGGAFMQRAWAELRRIRPGETLTYTELAAACGSPKAVRAAGSACAKNAVALIVPCHRIVRTDGSLGGYQYGLAVKRWLLHHEAAVAA